MSISTNNIFLHIPKEKLSTMKLNLFSVLISSTNNIFLHIPKKLSTMKFKNLSVLISYQNNSNQS